MVIWLATLPHTYILDTIGAGATGGAPLILLALSAPNTLLLLHSASCMHATIYSIYI